jgi:hypothetical protein
MNLKDSIIKKFAIKIRNFVFVFFEKILIALFRIIPRSRKDRTIIVFFTSRAGRGLKISDAASSLFDSYPEQLSDNSRFLKFNSRIWLINTFKLLAYSTSYKDCRVVLHQYVPNFYYSPSLKLLEFVDNRGAKVVKIWMDTYNDYLWDLRINKISHLGNLNIIIDTPKLRTKKFTKGNSYRYLPIPIKSLPLEAHSVRTHFLYYSGGVEEYGIYKPRKDVLDFLEQNEIRVDGTRYNRTHPGKRPDYATYRSELSKSLIGLNFTWKGDSDVLVTRTWEILSSGTLLLQNKSDLFQGLLTSGIHYLEFSSNSELLELLKTLKNDRIRLEQIALAGRKQYKSLFPTETFWEAVVGSDVQILR